MSWCDPTLLFEGVTCQKKIHFMLITKLMGGGDCVFHPQNNKKMLSGGA